MDILNNNDDGFVSKEVPSEILFYKNMTQEKLLTPEEELTLAKTISVCNSNISIAMADALFVIQYILEKYKEYEIQSSGDLVEHFVLGFTDFEQEEPYSKNNLDEDEGGEKTLCENTESHDDTFVDFTINKFAELNKIYQSIVNKIKNGAKSKSLEADKKSLSALINTFIFTPSFFEELIKYLDERFQELLAVCKTFSSAINDKNIPEEFYHRKEFYLISHPSVKGTVSWFEKEDLEKPNLKVLLGDSLSDVEVAVKKLSDISELFYHEPAEIIDIYNNIKHEYLLGKQARDKMILANTRLVMHEARKFSHEDQCLFEDLCQYGIFGLIKAIEKFDYTKGFKLSTYATWWVKQYINRAIDTDIKPVRVPVNKEEKLKKIQRFCFTFYSKNNREPNDREISEALDIPISLVSELKNVSRPILSLNSSAKNGSDDNSFFEDFPDDENPTPLQNMENYNLIESINVALSQLTFKEADIIRKRFGIDSGISLTLEEIAKTYNVKAERIRQIEAKTLRKLSHSAKFSFLRELVGDI